MFPAVNFIQRRENNRMEVYSQASVVYEFLQESKVWESGNMLTRLNTYATDPSPRNIWMRQKPKNAQENKEPKMLG